MIYDCFSYWDEDLLLDLRLNILNEYVDFFVIVEGDKTWQNNPKNLNFDINKFKKFEEKIIYVPVTDLPNGIDPYLRENHQRNCIQRGLNTAKDDDLIIVSDLDEIPNPDVFKNFQISMRYAVFNQKHFYYRFNLQSQRHPYWLGSRICQKKFLKSPQWLRNLKFKKRPIWRIDKFRLNNILENGGWHFCNIKSEEKLLNKYKNLCETNDPVHFNEKIDQRFLNLDEIKKRVKDGDDILGRDDKFLKVNIDRSYPKYFLNNLTKYKVWID